MKGETDLIDKCKRVQMKTKLRTGSYCFLATLAFQEGKSKARRKQLTTLRSYISERFYVKILRFVFAVYKLPTCACVSCCMAIFVHPKMGF